MTAQIAIEPKEINDFCRRNHIRKLALFGSVLRSDFTPESDVDVLVEFDDGHVPGLIRFQEIEESMSEAIFANRPVDLLTPKSLNRWIRTQVLAEAEVQYAKE